jgi:hypothetical protein
VFRKERKDRQVTKIQEPVSVANGSSLQRKHSRRGQIAPGRDAVGFKMKLRPIHAAAVGSQTH